MVKGMTEALPHPSGPELGERVIRVDRSAVCFYVDVFLKIVAEGLGQFDPQTPKSVVYIGVHPGNEDVVLLFAERSPNMEIFASASEFAEFAAKSFADAS